MASEPATGRFPKSLSVILAFGLVIAIGGCLGPQKQPTEDAAPPAKASTRKAAVTPPAPAAPTEPAAFRIAEFEIAATTFNRGGKIPDDVPVYPVTYDPHIYIWLRVEEILDGDSPFREGQEIVLLVHSPTLMFGGYGFDGKSFAYRFAVVQQDDATSYQLIGLDIWPKD